MRFKVCIFVLYPFNKNGKYEAKNVPVIGNDNHIYAAACTSGPGGGCPAAA